MRNIFFTLITISLAISTSFAQKEGQSFCEGDSTATYFPIDIQTKKIFWRGTYYLETISGSKIINGKDYTEFTQKWDSGDEFKLYLRQENDIIYQYEECCEEDTIRIDPNLKEGASWQSADKLVEYTVESFSGELRTPYCRYKNLLVLNGKFGEGEFKFYYQKGYGYVGATLDGKLISIVTPEF